jgi:hypothetical protein
VHIKASMKAILGVIRSLFRYLFNFAVKFCLFAVHFKASMKVILGSLFGAFSAIYLILLYHCCKNAVLITHFVSLSTPTLWIGLVYNLLPLPFESFYFNLLCFKNPLNKNFIHGDPLSICYLFTQ